MGLKVTFFAQSIEISVAEVDVSFHVGYDELFSLGNLENVSLSGKVVDYSSKRPNISLRMILDFVITNFLAQNLWSCEADCPTLALII